MESPAAQPLFNPAALLPGDILHAYTEGFAPRLIKKVLKIKGSHDALIVKTQNGFSVVESLFSTGGTQTSLETYEKNMRAGKTRVCILRIWRPTDAERQRASEWMVDNIVGTPYDVWAFPRLLLKAAFGDWIPKAAGMEWAWYCTESVRDAWLHAGWDVWRKKSPTPGTTEKRVAAGLLVDVSESCLTPEGQKYRLELE